MSYNFSDIVNEYDKYIQLANKENKYESGWRPVSFQEFLEDEYPLIVSCKTLRDAWGLGADENCRYIKVESDKFAKIANILIDNTINFKSFETSYDAVAESTAESELREHYSTDPENECFEGADPMSFGILHRDLVGKNIAPFIKDIQDISGVINDTVGENYMRICRRVSPTNLPSALSLMIKEELK